MDELTSKIVAEGEAEAKAYEEYVQWCQSAVQDTGFAIETASREKTELEAKIAELTSEIDGCGSKTEELAAAIATNEADLKSATGIREKELEDFIKSEKELMEVISEIDRAISILEKEMAKKPSCICTGLQH
jgi:chromosome segregation ATPase